MPAAIQPRPSKLSACWPLRATAGRLRQVIRSLRVSCGMAREDVEATKRNRGCLPVRSSGGEYTAGAANYARLFTGLGNA